MESTLFEVTLVIVMVAANVALFIWFRRALTRNSFRRMMSMMTRVRLDTGSVADSGPGADGPLEEARRRCLRCPREDFCERWLAGEVVGPNTFCPNVSVFRSLTRGPSASAG